MIPNILLVGAYPASQDDQETFHIITSILKFGVQKFVCLQQEVFYFFMFPKPILVLKSQFQFQF